MTLDYSVIRDTAQIKNNRTRYIQFRFIIDMERRRKKKLLRAEKHSLLDRSSWKVFIELDWKGIAAGHFLGGSAQTTLKDSMAAAIDWSY